MTTTYMTEASIELAEIALKADGIVPQSMGNDFLFNEAKHNLANVIGELWNHVRNVRIVMLTDEVSGKHTFVVYSGDFLLAEKDTARGALEQAHSDYSPCAILG